jgi:regulator of replication initiation timing
MQEELDALQAQLRGLQALVSELLLINQTLRLETEELRQKSDPDLQAAPLHARQHR